MSGYILNENKLAEAPTGLGAPQAGRVDTALPVIIITYGRSRLTEITLESLVNTTPLDKIKLIVIDNGSGEKTLDIIDRFSKEIDVLVKLGKNCGKPYALNLGASIADGMDFKPVKGLTYPEGYLFCDNDLEFKDDWLPAMTGTFKAFRGEKLGWLSGYMYRDLNVHVEKNGFVVDKESFAPGCCSLVSREAFLEVGPFATEPDDHGYTGLIKMVDTRYIKRLAKAGFWNGVVVPGVIEHIGRTMRSWNMATSEPILYD